MKIVDRNTFMSLPAGTIFAAWAFREDEGVMEHEVSSWRIKGDSLGYGDNGQYSDWIENRMELDFAGSNGGDHFEFLARLNDGEELQACFDCTGRDGCFDESDRFVVLDANEATAMVDVWVRAVALATKDRI